MRTLLFTGKGGDGTSTVAAATAARLARGGDKTLLLSVHPAHHLADTLGVPVGAEPAEIGAGLYAARVDTRRGLGQSWPMLRDLLDSLSPLGDGSSVSADELALLPAVEPTLALLQVRDHANSGRWDTMVLDCATTVDALRLVALPTTLAWYVGRLVAHHRPTRPASGTPATTVGALAEAVADLRMTLAEVDSLLRSADTSVRLVLTPRAAAVAEARRTATALALHGHLLEEVVVTQVLPDQTSRHGGEGDDRYQGWVRSQQRQLALIAELFADVPVRRVPRQVDEPVGVAALLDLADQAIGLEDPSSSAGPVEGRPHGQGRGTAGPSVRVDQVADGFEWALRLPLVERDQLDLARVDDGLVVTLDDHRRVIPLPAVLRRCTVEGARLADGWLRVRFRPDPARWPTALLSAADRWAHPSTVGGTDGVEVVEQ
ncbi:MAG TPA: ArsA family ATPase [Mycobacteriales bacterium]